MISSCRVNFYDFIERIRSLESKGKEILRLDIGETNMPTPEIAVEAAAKALKERKAGYGPPAGLMQLRERIALREKCRVEEVVIGPGSKQLIYGILRVTCSCGEKVLLPTPTWPAYELMCRDLGISVKHIRTELQGRWEFQLSKEELKASKILMMCCPLNPTGTIYVSDNRADAAAAGVLTVCDQTYLGLSFEPRPVFATDIRIRSLSKEFCMEGWRIGYAILPEYLAKRLTAFNQLTITCIPSFIQEAALACLEHEDSILPGNRALWKKRAEEYSRILRKLAFSFAEPQAGFYIFVTHPLITSSIEFCDRLLDAGVAVCPGTFFGGYDSFLRICLNQPFEQFSEAGNRIAKALSD